MQKKRNIWITFIIISLLILCIVHLTFSASIKSKKNQIQAEMENSLSIQQYLYLEDNTEVLSELLLTKDFTQELIDYSLHDNDTVQLKENNASLHKKLNSMFTMLINRIELIDQISFVSVTGNEISTVYLNDTGEIKTVAPENLSNKATQDYFLKSKQLDDYSIYISSLDLNISKENKDPNQKQYVGWPITISQLDNFNPKKTFQLPTLELSKEDQVVTIKKSTTNEVISSLRINGKTFQPKVLELGSYTIEVGEGYTPKKYFNIYSEKKNKKKIKVQL